MKIVPLSDEHRKAYLHCLEEWSEDMRDAGDKKARWCAAMEGKGLGVRVAIDDDGKACGMIQYVPIEMSQAEGEGLCFIQCIWVHGHKEGVGNRQRRGMGRALLKAAEEDARAKGAKGMAAWGLSLPFWMPAKFFLRHGYEKADKSSIAVLVWKRFSDDARPPRWVKQSKAPQLIPGKVSVVSFAHGWCPAQNTVYERAKRAAKEVGGHVVFTEIDTSDRANLLEWGLCDALFIDGKEVRTGPPPSYEKIKSLIEKRAKKLKK